MHIEIDENSGFCFGVKQAIKQAEDFLKDNKTLYCLGEIVHNSEEVKRLENLDMKTIHHSDLSHISNTHVLLRAHGEPPSTYDTLRKNNIQFIDGSCPVVLHLQKKIKKAWEENKPINGQIVIFGKKDHAEVIGLNGQTNNEAIIVSNIDEIHTIDFARPVALFAQTTMNGDDYKQLAKAIKEKMLENFTSQELPFSTSNSICGHVSGRGEKMKLFSKKHDTIIFASGLNSSNGKVLFHVCLDNNPNSHWVPDVQSLKMEWFENSKSVGICGATSTPYWLMEQIAKKIEQLKKD
jgi:4-hydroxy-3-methylbut-2-en-1-yl diphosphate reductase